MSEMSAAINLPKCRALKKAAAPWQNFLEKERLPADLHKLKKDYGADEFAQLKALLPAKAFARVHVPS